MDIEWFDLEDNDCDWIGCPDGALDNDGVWLGLIDGALGNNWVRLGWSEHWAIVVIDLADPIVH